MDDGKVDAFVSHVDAGPVTIGGRLRAVVRLVALWVVRGRGRIVEQLGGVEVEGGVGGIVYVASEQNTVAIVDAQAMMLKATVTIPGAAGRLRERDRRLRSVDERARQRGRVFVRSTQ